MDKATIMITYINLKDSTLHAANNKELIGSLPVVNADLLGFDKLRDGSAHVYLGGETGFHPTRLRSEPVALPGWGLEEVYQVQSRDGWTIVSEASYDCSRVKRQAYRLVRSEPEKPQLPEDYNHAKRVIRDEEGKVIGYEAFNLCVKKQKPIDERLDRISKKIAEKPAHGFCVTPGSTCNMNYCDENGCQDRKRELVEPSESQEETDEMWMEVCVDTYAVEIIGVSKVIKKLKEKFTITRK